MTYSPSGRCCLDMSQITSLLIAQGAPIVLAAASAARIGVPVPAAPFLVISRGLAACGQMSWVAAPLAAVVASNLGGGLWFWVRIQSPPIPEWLL